MDTRTKRQKLEAMASQTAASPREAEIARRKLDEGLASAPRTLSRAAILSAPDLRAGVGTRRVYDRALHVVVVVDEDDPAFSAPGLDWDRVE